MQSDCLGDSGGSLTNITLPFFFFKSPGNLDLVQQTRLLLLSTSRGTGMRSLTMDTR